MAFQSPSSEVAARINQYLSRLSVRVNIERFLGDGTDGEVWASSRETAIKALARESGYYNERDTYLRLQEWGIGNQICGFFIPELIGYDDELRIVEMELMYRPPYIIDFAKVRLDRPPDFSDEVLRDQEALGREQFEHRWPDVKNLLDALESYQIYYLDPKRGNITFPDLS